MSYREYYKRHLPHWQPLNATLFVTFRLAGSLPQVAIDRLRADRDADWRNATQMENPAQRRSQRYADERRAFARWDEALDRSTVGPHWLARAEIATIVAEALHHRDSKVYDFLAFCIMPNHVHLVCTPLPGGRTTSPAYDEAAVAPRPAHDEAGVAPSPGHEARSLSSILQSLKARTARQANARLGRHGAFWQEESYDHVVRDMEELERIIHYVIKNPEKAGLVQNWRDWPWTYSRPDWQSGQAGQE